MNKIKNLFSPEMVVNRGGCLAPCRASRARHLFPECVALLLAGGQLLLPALHVGRGLLQRVHQPGVVLPQGLQLRFPLLGVGVAAARLGMQGNIQTG